MGWPVYKLEEEAPHISHIRVYTNSLMEAWDYGAAGIVRFQPSNDMGDAWQVVEKLRAEGWVFELTEGSFGPAGNQDHAQHNRMFDASFETFDDDDSRYFTSTHDEAPMAICLAALQVMGIVCGEE